MTSAWWPGLCFFVFFSRSKNFSVCFCNTFIKLFTIIGTIILPNGYVVYFDESEAHILHSNIIIL